MTEAKLYTQDELQELVAQKIRRAIEDYTWWLGSNEHLARDRDESWKAFMNNFLTSYAEDEDDTEVIRVWDQHKNLVATLARSEGPFYATSNDESIDKYDQVQVIITTFDSLVP